MKEIIINTIIKIKKKEINDPTAIEDLESLTKLLLENLSETINVLKILDEEYILWLSSEFEELSYKFQSKEFIDCLKNLLIKFPESYILKKDVQEAIEAYYGDE